MISMNAGKEVHDIGVYRGTASISRALDTPRRRASHHRRAHLWLNTRVVPPFSCSLHETSLTPRRFLMMDSYLEIARRLRHDLVKNLDIPQKQVPISIPQLRVLVHRIYEPGTGLCAMAPIWLFKVRKCPLYVPAFDAPFQKIERSVQTLKDSEKKVKALNRTLDPIIPNVVVDALECIADHIRYISSVCIELDKNAIESKNESQITKNVEVSSISSNAFSFDETLDDDALAALDFMGLNLKDESSVRRPVKKAETAKRTQKKRVLVVDDQLISIERLMAYPALNERFDWVTLCHNDKPCEFCQSGERCENKRARSWGDLARALRYERDHRQNVDLILMDVRFDTLQTDELLWIPDMPNLNDEEHVKALQGLIIARVLKRDADFSKIPIILMTERSSLPEGANQLLEGLEGLQFVDDDNSLDALAARMEGVISMAQPHVDESRFFWGNSNKMQLVRRQAELMSFGPRTVFITGPSGAGKSFIVENVIYPNSQRQPLVTIDLSAVPENLVESELFGHVKGSFSGADRDRPGLIEEAEGGILFLDEIGNLSLENQKKLLLFLNDKMVRRVGAPFTSRHHVDVKVVTATHLDLAKEVEAGRFRFDLFMRLAPAIAIVLPTLAERREDLGDLVKMLISKLASGDEMKPYIQDYAQRCHTDPVVRVDFGDGLGSTNDAITIRFTKATRELFENYSWPGNTRELETILDALFMKTVYDAQQGQLLSKTLEIDHYFALSLLGAIAKSDGTVQAGHAAVAQADWVPSGPYSGFPDLRQKLERAFLCHAYEQAEGSMDQLALSLFGDNSEKTRHKIAIRFNQLGISLRQMRGRVS